MFARVFAGNQTVLLREELRRGKNAVEFASGNLEIARLTGSGGDDHGVVFALQVFAGDVDADVDAGFEFHAFGLHQLDAAFNDLFFEFEIGNAVAEESAGLEIALIDRDFVSVLIEDRRGGKSGGTGADDGDRFSGTFRHVPDLHKSLFISLFHNVAFNLANRDRFEIETAGAGAFAESGADARGEFRKRARG